MMIHDIFHWRLALVLTYWRLALVLRYIIAIVAHASSSLRPDNQTQQEPGQNCQSDTIFKSDFPWMMIGCALLIGFMFAIAAVSNIAEHEFYDVDLVARDVFNSSSYLSVIQPLAATIFTPSIGSENQCSFLDSEHLPVLSYCIAGIATIGSVLIHWIRAPITGIKWWRMFLSCACTIGAFLATYFAAVMLLYSLLQNSKLSKLWFVCATTIWSAVAIAATLGCVNRVKTTPVRSFTWSAIAHYEMMLKMINLAPAGANAAARNHLQLIIPHQYAFVTNIGANHWQQQLQANQNNLEFQFLGTIPNMSRLQAREFQDVFADINVKKDNDPNSIFQWHFEEFRNIRNQLPINFPI